MSLIGNIRPYVGARFPRNQYAMRLLARHLYVRPRNGRVCPWPLPQFRSGTTAEWSRQWRPNDERDGVATREPEIEYGALYTDFYELSMAQLYFRRGIHEKRAIFEYFFRNYPDYGGHQAGYCILAGTEWFLDWLQRTRFDTAALRHLREHTSRSGRRLFNDDFLDWLGHVDLLSGLSIRVIPEGRAVHPQVPLIVVEGPLAVAQLLETALLNHVNYQTLVATKAARIKEAGAHRPMIEFGMRRAHERAANAGARAALIGGAQLTSNSAASYSLGFPPAGTHSHSMVQAFMAMGEGERGAFEAYADVYPDDCLLLVDTVNTLHSGMPNAIKVFERLRAEGHRPLGIRLDSGDLAYLSVRAARMLDDAGFEDASIVLSNQIDEVVLTQVLSQIRDEAPRYGLEAERVVGRLVYGVGTKLITSAGAGALDGVYKLVAMEQRGRWVPAFKMSESVEKTINPGNKRAWRLYGRNGFAIADCLSLADETPAEHDPLVLHHPFVPDEQRRLELSQIGRVEPLQVDLMAGGKLVGDLPEIKRLREARDRDVSHLHPGVKRLVNPHRYHVSLTKRLWSLKWELAESARASSPL
jgi:nicotinate phosphoribosyltransferase